MNQPKKFKTKNGYCHILSDRIVFTHSGLYGQLGDLAGEGKMIRVLVVYTLMTVLSAYFSYFNHLKGEAFWFILFAVITVYLAYAVLMNWNTTLHPIIYRERIVEGEYRSSGGRFTYPVFVIKIKNSKGKLRKRLITLPLATKKNQTNNLEALKMMREEKLVSF